MSARGALTRLCAGACAALALAPAHAGARQSATVTLDGPRAGLLELGGAAMAADGTGGLVYRALADNQPHIFVIRFDRGTWSAPQRVDGGQRYASSWPRIAAAPGGRLLVTWVQEGGPGTDRLYGALLPERQERFEPPVQIDPAIGEGTATFPSLAAAGEGAGLVSYLVPGTITPDGRIFASVRVARFDGARWRRMGAINRDLGEPLPALSAATAAKVGLAASGTGLVTWIERDGSRIDRAYVRRVFPARLGTVQRISPTELGGAAVDGAVDAVGLSVAPSGAAFGVWRQTAGSGQAVAGTRLMGSTLPALSGGAGGGQWSEPAFVDGAGAARAAVAPAGAFAPAVADDGSWRLAFGRGGAVEAVVGDRERAGAARRLGDAGALVPAPVAVASPAGAGAFAWGQTAEDGTVAVVEDPLDGADLHGLAAARFAGTVADVHAGGSGSGDALVAFRQGEGPTAQIAAFHLDAAPAAFAVVQPEHALRPEAANVSWRPAADAFGAVRYRVLLEGRTVERGVRATSATLPASALEDGDYAVRVVATDRGGQETATPQATVRIDGTPPRIAHSSGRRTLTVRFSDGGRGAGVDAQQSIVRWGDGETSAGTGALRHTYRREGRFRVRATAVDRAGNRRTSAWWETIR